MPVGPPPGKLCRPQPYLVLILIFGRIIQGNLARFLEFDAPKWSRSHDTQRDVRHRRTFGHLSALRGHYQQIKPPRHSISSKVTKLTLNDSAFLRIFYKVSLKKHSSAMLQTDGAAHSSFNMPIIATGFHKYSKDRQNEQPQTKQKGSLAFEKPYENYFSD